jgi:ABC-type uncharacterized transport system permease subunit
MHDIVTSDWFLLITGVCSVFGLLLAIFATTKVMKIDNSIKMRDQNITVSGIGNTTSGRDNVINGK